LCASGGIESVDCITKVDLIYVIQQHEIRNDIIDENDDDVHDSDNDDDDVTSERCQMTVRNNGRGM